MRVWFLTVHLALLLPSKYHLIICNVLSGLLILILLYFYGKYPKMHMRHIPVLFLKPRESYIATQNLGKHFSFPCLNFIKKKVSLFPYN
jgi:hypothetical protein